MKKRCATFSPFEVYAFAMAWINDAMNDEDDTIGPSFTAALDLYETDKNCSRLSDEASVYFLESAVRDYILTDKRVAFAVERLKEHFARLGPPEARIIG